MVKHSSMLDHLEVGNAHKLAPQSSIRFLNWKWNVACGMEKKRGQIEGLGAGG